MAMQYKLYQSVAMCVAASALPTDTTDKTAAVNTQLLCLRARRECECVCVVCVSVCVVAAAFIQYE